jgi:hypothetical protein
MTWEAYYHYHYIPFVPFKSIRRGEATTCVHVRTFMIVIWRKLSGVIGNKPLGCYFFRATVRRMPFCKGDVPAHYRCLWAHCGEYSPLLPDSCLTEQRVGDRRETMGGSSPACSVEKLERSRYYQYTYLHNFPSSNQKVPTHYVIVHKKDERASVHF